MKKPQDETGVTSIATQSTDRLPALNPNAPADQAVDDRVTLTGFGDRREGLTVRPHSSIWGALEDEQNRIWGIARESEQNRQNWRDRMADFIEKVERFVQPLISHTSRMGVTDKDMKLRVARHRLPVNASDTNAYIPSVTIESSIIEFVDVGSVEFFPMSTKTIRATFKRAGATGESIAAVIPLQHYNGAWYIRSPGWVRGPRDEMIDETLYTPFTAETFATIVGQVFIDDKVAR